MKFIASLITAISAAAVVSAQCTAEKRINVMRGITAAFNQKGLLESAAAIQAMPLQRDCPAIVYLNGAPGIEFGFDASTTKNFANIVRQAFTNVVSEYTDYGNGTTLMDAQVTLGVLQVVDLPFYAHILVPAEFNMTTCLLRTLPAFVTVPTDIGGNPITPPTLPAIPGIAKFPGLREILPILVPALSLGGIL